MFSNWQHFVGDLPGASAGNRVRHLPHDHEAVDVIWDMLEGAERRIWMTMYTLVPDELGRGTLHRLADAAARGVDVRLIYDHEGSYGMRDEHLALLRNAGGRTALFHPLWRIWNPNSIIVRNHRKFYVVDDEALCGGMNLSNDYTDGDNFGDWIFDDTMARVEGPCVHDLGRTFRRTWRDLTGERLCLPERPAPFEDGVTVAALETDPRRDEEYLDNALAGAVRRAKTRCFISTPYFVPPPSLSRALQDAAQRGVDVRVLTAGQTDRAVARWAGWHRFERFLRAGVRIFELFGRILHSKTMTVDGAFGSIGSYNMDAWTIRHTLDLNLLIASSDVARSIEEEFQNDMPDAKEIMLEEAEDRDPLHRLAHGLTYHAYRWL
jgi:cardiolipin synthase